MGRGWLRNWGPIGCAGTSGGHGSNDQAMVATVLIHASLSVNLPTAEHRAADDMPDVTLAGSLGLGSRENRRAVLAPSNDVGPSKRKACMRCRRFHAVNAHPKPMTPFLPVQVSHKPRGHNDSTDVIGTLGMDGFEFQRIWTADVRRVGGFLVRERWTSSISKATISPPTMKILLVPCRRLRQTIRSLAGPSSLSFLASIAR
jgi:hypothetical protein